MISLVSMNLITAFIYELTMKKNVKLLVELPLNDKNL